MLVERRAISGMTVAKENAYGCPKGEDLNLERSNLGVLYLLGQRHPKPSQQLTPKSRDICFPRIQKDSQPIRCLRLSSVGTVPFER